MIFHRCRQRVSNVKSYKLTVVISQCVYCFYARIDYSAVCESELVNCIDFFMKCVCVEVVCCVWCTAVPSQPIMPNTVLNAAIYATHIPYKYQYHSTTETHVLQSSSITVVLVLLLEGTCITEEC